MTEEHEVDISIDRDNLDLEVISQPEMFYKVASDHAMAVSRKDSLYEEMKQVDASLNLEIRKEKEEAGEKCTETIVSATVQAHHDHVDSYNQFLEAKKEADQLAALKDTLMQRSHMLKELVQLYVCGYYSDTALGTDTAEVQGFKKERSKERVKSSRKRSV